MNLPLEVGDIGNPKKLWSVFSRHQLIAVVHLAGKIDVAESVRNPSLYWSENVEKPLVLLDTMRSFGVRRIVFSSTCAVHGNDAYSDYDGHLSEDADIRPVSPYAMTKATFETVLSTYRAAYGLEPVVLRYFNAAGAAADVDIGEFHDPETHLIPLLLHATATGKTFKVFGTDYPTYDGTCIRDYVHVTDLATAHVAALSDQLEADTFNLGTGYGFSVLEVIAEVERVTGKEIRWEAAPRRKGDPVELIAVPTKARKVLNWSPQHSSLGNIIRTAWAFYQRKEQP